MIHQKIMKIYKNPVTGQLTMTIPRGYNLQEGDFISFTPTKNQVEIKKVIL